MKRVLIVGASLAGVRAAVALRRLGYGGELTLLGDEPHAPYDRPPLSKELMRGTWEVARLELLKQTPEQLGLRLRLGERACGLDLTRRELLLERERLPFDGLVIATGARARELPAGPRLPGVHVLRTLDDARALAAVLAQPSALAIVGAGFLGAEVAASARASGCEVTLIEREPAPLASLLGRAVGDVLAQVHREHGVDLRLGVAVASLEGRQQLEQIRLSDGSVLPARNVLVAVGALPNTEWLAESGVRVQDGVCCDQRCNVLDTAGQPIPQVVAAGDVARYESALFGESLRVEHWTHAAEQADHAAQTLLGERSPFVNAPLFWSDQYGMRLQFAGRTAGADRFHVCEGSLEERRFVALYGRGSRLVGALALRRPAQLMRYRKLIEARADFDELIAAHA